MICWMLASSFRAGMAMRSFISLEAPSHEPVRPLVAGWYRSGRRPSASGLRLGAGRSLVPPGHGSPDHPCLEGEAELERERVRSAKASVHQRRPAGA